MKAKGLFLSVLLIGLVGGNFEPCFGQTKDVYKSLTFSFVNPLSYEHHKTIKTNFCFEIGYNYAFRLRNKLYFQTGAGIERLSFSGTDNKYKESSHTSYDTGEKIYNCTYSSTFLKVPFDLCLMLPLGEKAVFSPSIGLSLSGVISSYSKKVNDSVVKEGKKYDVGFGYISYDDIKNGSTSSSGFNVGIMIPELGFSLIIDRLLFGMKYEMMWATGDDVVNYSSDLLVTVGYSF